MAYAAKTRVPVDRTRSEIERLVMRYRAQQYGTATDYESRQARVQFRVSDRIVRFTLKLPTEKVGTDKFAQQERSRWRALLLVIKAKFEAIDAGVATFEEEFLPHIVMPNDKTIAELALPVVAQAYKDGRMPRALLTEGENG